MGAYKYVSELYRKKQSDVMRYLLRVRYLIVMLYYDRCLCWDLRTHKLPSHSEFNPVLWIRTHFFRIRIHKLFFSDSDSDS
jgi:hypothetical protein